MLSRRMALEVERKSDLNSVEFSPFFRFNHCMQGFFYIGLFFVSLGLITPIIHAQDIPRSCDFGNNIVVPLNEQRCVRNSLYKCEDPSGSMDDCGGRNQNCWYTNFSQTNAQCFAKTERGCAGSDGVIYRKGESWCDSGLLNV